ncbi:MAG: FprA family A-type flavoprotein [Synergistales bacterium]|nr:FprA family A-type flavoprotein [Synergistales bacterium]
MHQGIAITDSIYWVGENDRETDLFEALWPLPRGVSYNSYCIMDDKVALIDTVKGGYFPDFLEKLKGLLGPSRTVDYLVINHMEPDHSGAVKVLREIYPDMTVVGNAKTREFLANFYGITENFRTVSEGESLDLGKRQLRFSMIPMVHWPETMVTYASPEGVLFSGDAFGAFGSLDGGIFDDEVDMAFYEDEMLRYFSNIVGRYGSQVQKAIGKVRGLDVRYLAPAHGPILRDSPEQVIDLYDRWSRHETEEGVVVVYGSMYGNTKRMAESVARSLAREGIERVILHDISRSHISFVVRDIWRYRGVVLAGCTYNTGLFPPMQALTASLENKMMRGRVLGVCGSYSWSKGALAALLQFGERGNWELVEPYVEVRSAPSPEDIEQCYQLGRNVAGAL